MSTEQDDFVVDDPAEVDAQIKAEKRTRSRKRTTGDNVAVEEPELPDMPPAESYYTWHDFLAELFGPDSEIPGRIREILVAIALAADGKSDVVLDDEFCAKADVNRVQLAVTAKAAPGWLAKGAELSPQGKARVVFRTVKAIN